MELDNRNILILNDDCLESILDYLPSIQDQLNFARVCTRFTAAFGYWSKTKYKCIDYNVINHLKPTDQNEFFKFAGGSILHCSVSLDANMLPIISKYCMNIRNVSFVLRQQWQNVFTSSIERLCLLENFIIYVKKDSQDVMEHLLLTLNKHTQLKGFGFNTPHYDGKYLCELKHLQQLVVYDSSSLLALHIQKGYLAMKNLQTLHLLGCTDWLTTNNFLVMSQHCEQLEEIVFSDCNAKYELIADLPKLKRIGVDGLIIRPEFFRALAAKKSHQLECLKVRRHNINAWDSESIACIKSLRELHCQSDQERSFNMLSALPNLEILRVYSSKLHNNHLTATIKACEKLHFIDVYNCRCITSHFIWEAYEVLTQQPRRHLPIKIYVRLTNVWKDIRENPEFYKTKDALHLHFNWNKACQLSLMKIYD